MSKFEGIVGQAGDPLARLFQTTGGQKIPDRLAGYVFRMDYERALVITNDFYREEVKGVPQNSFLLACAFDPTKLSEVPSHNRFVILLRVLGPGRLPQESEYTAALIQHFQDKTERGVSAGRDGIDEYTHAQLQHGALECLILGSFYAEESKLCYGADVEDFVSASLISVYKPHDEALSAIVNYCDPARLEKSREDAKERGFAEVPKPFTIGAVRYTSTRRMQDSDHTAVPVSFETVDLLAKRTGVFGMTRTGKSNLVKTMISAVQNSVMAAHGRVGQLILDLNGEYANANAQDKGAISEVFDGNVVRYRDRATAGFFDIRPNFYKSYDIGLSNLQNAVHDQAGSEDFTNFVQLTIAADRPPSTDPSARNRWDLKVASYKCLLFAADYPYATDDNRVSFQAGKKVLSQIQRFAHDEFDPPAADNEDARAAVVSDRFDPSAGMTLAEAKDFFRIIRKADIALRRSRAGAGYGIESSTKGKAWLEPGVCSMLNLIAGETVDGRRIRGTGPLNRIVGRHSARGSSGVDRKIYEYLSQGRIVIVDLSSSLPSTKEHLMEQIAGSILDRSFTQFVDGRHCPAILIYVEEAHNLIGKNAEPDETWPRIAKEGAKANIGLIYATQEPSTIQRNILSNSENILSSHLNNDDEIKTLAKYYDFADFAGSIKRAQDVGFIRMKRLSAPFVLPVQVTKFEPESIRAKFLSLLPGGFKGAEKPAMGTDQPSGPKVDTTDSHEGLFD